jgi:mannitol 2-dehydrogenase
MTTQLNAANLNLLDQNIQVPKYDRRKVGQSIMHVGVGGFHRAHQALYMDDLLHQDGDSHWGYCELAEPISRLNLAGVIPPRFA